MKILKITIENLDRLMSGLKILKIKTTEAKADGVMLIGDINLIRTMAFAIKRVNIKIPVIEAVEKKDVIVNSYVLADGKITPVIDINNEVKKKEPSTTLNISDNEKEEYLDPSELNELFKAPPTQKNISASTKRVSTSATETDANAVIAKAKTEAKNIKAIAETEAKNIIAEAKAKAKNIIAEAQVKAQAILVKGRGSAITATTTISDKALGDINQESPVATKTKAVKADTAADDVSISKKDRIAVFVHSSNGVTDKELFLRAVKKKASQPGVVFITAHKSWAEETLKGAGFGHQTKTYYLQSGLPLKGKNSAYSQRYDQLWLDSDEVFFFADSRRENDTILRGALKRAADLKKIRMFVLYQKESEAIKKYVFDVFNDEHK